ncbi:MAG: DUF115 domain-containing protein [Magnetospirillum sp. WYHS-4]
MSGDGETPLVTRNREAFRRFYPKVLATLEELGPPKSRLVVDGGVARNILVENTPLYPKAADLWTAEQLGQYFDHPDRIGFASPANCNLSPVSRRLLDKIAAYFQAPGAPALAQYPVVDVGYAFLFGIGLGYAVPEFVRRDLARVIVLVEPVPEFLLHSLSAIDWQEVFEMAEAKGITLRFVVGFPPRISVQAIESLIVRHGQTFLEGAYSFLGYYSWEITEARALLNEKLKVYFISSGYFEDELLMMRNSYLNLRRHAFHMVSRQPHLRQDVPVFVVGSGPSLDAALPVIRKWRDRILVFSCGTSLGILLKNGIRPDFHNENENTAPLVKNLREFRDLFGFEGITLVASTTVDPGVPDLFDRCWFYFRDQLSSSILLKGEMRPIVGAGPLVANAAFAAIATLGFRNVYLVGVDCGRRPDAGHHAKDAVYYQEDYDNYLPGEGLELLENEFTRPVPGNFGGEVLTTWYLDMSRAAFSAAQGIFQANLVNCSNGARIDGARPQAVGSLSIAGDREAPRRAVTLAERQMPAFEPAAFFEALDFGRHRGAEARFTAAFETLMEEAIGEDQGFHAFEQRLLRLHRQGGDIDGILAIIWGSMRSMVRLGAFGGTRIADDAERKKFFGFFLGKYRAAVLWMAAEAGILLNEVADGRDSLSALGENQPE